LKKKKKKKSSKTRALIAAPEPEVSQREVRATGSVVSQQYLAAPQQMTYTMAPPVPTHAVQVKAVAQPMVQYAAPAVMPQVVQQQYVQQQYAPQQYVQQPLAGRTYG